MKLPVSHTVEKKLKSLSERLRYLTKQNNFYLNHVNPIIKSENLEYNLSLILAHIIINLQFVERNKEAFLNIIGEYNKQHNTSLSFEEFENSLWIRIVEDEVVMPELISHFIWQVGYYEKEGKPIKFPEGKLHLIRCLQLYYQRYYEDVKPTISLEGLNKIIKQYGSTYLSINFFVQRGILYYDYKKECS